jgi:hypothetical protein
MLAGVKLNAAGTHLLSNGMDNTLRTWDVRAYVSGGRLTGVFEGALVSGSGRSSLPLSLGRSLPP